MRKIFVFWIIFLIILAIGIGLTVCSKSVLRREEKMAEELKGLAIPRPSRAPIAPVAGKAEEEAAKDTSVPVTPELPPLQNIPVEINTNSLEISAPSPSGGSTALTIPSNPPERSRGSELPSLPQSEEPAQNE